MPATLEAESKLTDRYQTTVPVTVRRALRLGKRDKIHYTIRPGGEVVLTRAETSKGDDPLLGQFLGFLARDIASHPERLQTVDAGLVQRLHALIGDVEIDLDTALSADDE
jgi:antitoxin PrlF